VADSDRSPAVAAHRPAEKESGGQPAVSVTGVARLFTDGASRGNPGRAGAGICILDDAGRELVGFGCYLGQCTNNVAEYRALELGLEKALELGLRKLDIRLDSELVVRQIRGEYKVRNAVLKPLFDRVKKLLARLDDYSIRHVPRKENARADSLANQGIDSRSACDFGVDA